MSDIFFKNLNYTELYMGSAMGVVCVLLLRVYYFPYTELYMGSAMGVVCVLLFRVYSLLMLH